MTKRLLRLGAIGIALLGTWLPSGRAEAAYSPCNAMPTSTFGNYHHGLYRDHANVSLRGHKGYIETYNPWVSNSGNNAGSTAWVMLHNPGYGSGSKALAQMGWLKSAIPPTQGPPANPARANIFIEIHDQFGAPVRIYFGELDPGAGDVNRVYEVFTNRAGVWDFNIDGSNLHHIPNDGSNNWAPNQTQTSAETLRQPASRSNAGDQTPGDRDEWVGFKEMKVHISGAWAFEDYYAGGPNGGYFELDHPNARMTTNKDSTTRWFWYKPYLELSTGKAKEFDIRDLRCPN